MFASLDLTLALKPSISKRANEGKPDHQFARQGVIWCFGSRINYFATQLALDCIIINSL